MTAARPIAVAQRRVAGSGGGAFIVARGVRTAGTLFMLGGMRAQGREGHATMWRVAGLFLALASAAFALGRARARGGFYDREVYGLTPAAHRRYALIFAAAAIYFAAALALRALPDVVPLGVLAALAIFYAASFVRGASDDE